MQREIFTDLNRADWLALRGKDLTSTESPALFGLSPYSTAFELWQRKKNNLVLELEDNTRIKLGRHLQAGIANYVGEEKGWTIKSLEGTYMRLPGLRIGASFDFEATCPINGAGLVECKNVDYLVHRNNWAEDEAPDHIEIQAQHQMLVSGHKWCVIVALVGGNNPQIMIRDKDEEIGNAIIKKAAEFWESINNNIPPTPDFLRDYDIISMIYDKRDKSKIIELPLLETDLQEYKQIQAQEKILEGRKNEIKARLLSESDEAAKIFAGAMTASISKVEGTPDTKWTLEELTDMIGTVKKGRSGYNRIVINERKQ